MKSAATRRKPIRHRFAAAAVAVGSAAVLAAVLFAVTGGGAGAAVATAIPALAPADSDTLVLAPYSSVWWAKVAAMSPSDMGLTGLDPASSGAEIKAIGYSRSQDHVKHDIPMTGPSRLFYIETANPDAAQTLADWLRHADGFEGRRAFVSGSTVIIGQSWVTDYKAPEQSMAGYAGTLTASEGSMYRNPDREVQSLAGSPDTAQGKALTVVMRSGFGFTEGTTWIGTSPDGASWSGDFRSGGVNPQQINFSQTTAALDATSVKLGEVVNNNVRYTGYSSGMSGILTSSTFRAPGKGSMGAKPAPAGITAVKDEAVSVVSDVTGWDAAATGIYSSKENVATQAVSASEHSMVVSFVYGAN